MIIKPARLVRWLALAASTAFFLFFSKIMSEHAICPIGGFELFFNGLFLTGFSLAGLFSGMVLLFLVMSALSIVFRRAYCGYLCPLGALQELFDRLGKAVLPRKIREVRLPAKVDRILRWVKYAVLASFVVFAALIGGHWMIGADPYIVLMSLFGAQGLAGVWSRNASSVVFFFAILVSAFFAGRLFCGYLCPAGAWYALLSKLSPTKIVRDENACVSCGRCSKACPMHIDVAKSSSVTSAECIGCRECVNACPKKGALSARTCGFEVPSALVPLIAAAAFAGGVCLAMANMPARGERPDRQNGGQQGPGVYKEKTRTDGAKRVGGAGCANCVGCGLCAVMKDSPFRAG